MVLKCDEKLKLKALRYIDFLFKNITVLTDDITPNQLKQLRNMVADI